MHIHYGIGDWEKQPDSYWKGGGRKEEREKERNKENWGGGRRRRRGGEGLLTKVVLSGNSFRVPTATSKTSSVPSRCSTSDWMKRKG